MICSKCKKIYECYNIKSNGNFYKTCNICREYLNDRNKSINIIKNYIKVSIENDLILLI